MSISDQNIKLDPQNPWPGLPAYNELGCDYFYGREVDTADLLRRVRLNPLTTLYSKSGLGKSSLLQAGLFPLLRKEHFLPVYILLDLSEDAKGSALEQAANKLQKELEAQEADFPAFEAGESLWRYLHRRDLVMWSKDNFPLIPVLVFDQFEEIFSRGAVNPERIEGIRNELADLIENCIPPEISGEDGRLVAVQLDLLAHRYRVVLSFREDFLPDIRNWERHIPSLLKNWQQTQPLSREQAIEAVQKAGAAILAPGAAEAIIKFVSDQDKDLASCDNTIEPVLLNLYCYQLNLRRLKDNASIIDAETVPFVGQDIFQDFYAEALDGMPKVAKFIEDELVQGNYRGSYPLDDALKEGFVTGDQLKKLVSDHRLLRIDRQRGIPRIELIHDRLVGVVRQARDKRLAEEQRRKAEAKATMHKWQIRGLIFVVLVLFSISFSMYKLKQKANTEVENSAALNLVFRAQDILDGTQAGSSNLAYLQILAAKNLKSTKYEHEVYSALVSGLKNFWNQQQIIETEAPINAIANYHNDNKFVTGRSDGILELWKIDNSRLLPQKDFQGEGKNFISSVAFSQGGNRIVTGGIYDKPLKIWDAKTGTKIVAPLMEHDLGVSSVNFSSDGKLIVSRSYKGSLRLWNAETGQVRELLKSNDMGNDTAALSPNGKLIVSGAKKGNLLQLWDANSGQLIDKQPWENWEDVSSVAFNQDGNRIVLGTDDGNVQLWDFNNQGKLVLLSTQKGHEDSVTSVAFNRDGKLIVSGSKDRNLRLWNVDDKGLLDGGLLMRGHTDTVSSVIFSDDSNFVVSGGRDKTLRLWNVKTPSLTSGDQLKTIASVAYNQDGTLIVSGSKDGTLRLWDAKTHQPIGEPQKLHTSGVSSVAFSPTEKLIVSGSYDKTLHLWNISNGKLESAEPLKGHEQGVSSVAFSPNGTRNGTRIVSGSDDGSVSLWDVKKKDDKTFFLCGGKKRDDETVFLCGGEKQPEPMKGHEDSVTSVAFSPDGKTIVSGSNDKTLRLWDASQGKLIGKLTGHTDAVTSVAFSSEGKVVSGSKDQTLILWDVQKGKQIKTLTGHTDWVTSVAFSADGKRIVSGSRDKTLLLWDVNKEKPISAPLKGHKKTVTSVAFNNENDWVVSGSADNTLQWWPVFTNTDDFAKELCKKLTRNMSYEEWRNLVPSDIPYAKQCSDLPIPQDKERSTTVLNKIFEILSKIFTE